MSVNVNQSGAREDAWQALTGGDGSPADRDAGGMAGWRCGTRGAAARRSRCAPSCFVLIGLVVTQRHARGDGGGFALCFIWIQLISQRHGLVVCLLRATYSAGHVAQRRMRVSVMVLVFEVTSSPVLAVRLVQWLRFTRSPSRRTHHGYCGHGNGRRP